ncbi:uncharacterized protein LOC122056055 isoform X1 [Zingiber officinale]|uniref:uncharacterized protein LOC122056055 isoform X1 n=1 Tax=Zingiber officinale TaxID=94328 RepID=UPI001C4AB70D|nr:uncharacterized protein LOC122056055 isoform X1 [Zingiber officinale]
MEKVICQCIDFCGFLPEKSWIKRTNQVRYRTKSCQKGWADQESEYPTQSTADMTAFLQNLLVQMQSRFQAMSEGILLKNILSIHGQ